MAVFQLQQLHKLTILLLSVHVVTEELCILTDETQHFTQYFITWLYITDGDNCHDNGPVKV